MSNIKHNLGIVAVVPFWSQSDNLNADSNYAYLRRVLPVMSKLSPHTLFLVFFPDPSYGKDRWVYYDDGMQTDKIRFISWPYDTAMRSSVLGFDAARFGVIENACAPSLYWVHQVEMAGALKGGYRESFSVSGQPGIISQHHYIIHESLPYPVTSMESRRLYQMSGTIASDIIVYNSRHARNMAHDSFSHYLNNEKMRFIEKNSITLPFGLVKDTDPIAPLASESNRPIFIYNHRFEAYKRPDVTFGVLNSLRNCYDFEVWASQAQGQPTGRWSIDKFIGSASRDTYLERIAVPAINTINSVHETFCISVLDSIAAGHLVVLPRAVTFPELVPENYPFLFDTVNEQQCMLSRILDRWPLDYNEWRERLQLYARTHHEITAYASQYLDLLTQEEARRRSSGMKPETREKVGHLVSRLPKGKPVRMSVLMRDMSKTYNLRDQAMPDVGLYVWHYNMRACLLYGLGTA